MSGSEPLYSVGTWDTDEQAFTPQIGLTVPSFNISLPQLRQAVRDLRRLSYSAHRVRFLESNGQQYAHEGDPMVLIERTDGESEAEILERWKR